MESRIQQAANGIALLEHLDTFAGLRNGLREVAVKHDDWAGIPMPLDDLRMVVHPKFPKGQELCEIGRAARQAREREALAAKAEEGVKLRNSWFSRSKMADVYIWEEPDGRILAGAVPVRRPAMLLLNTLGASYAWGIEQEARAVDLLGTLIRHVQFKQYMLTGMFLETSKRSGLTYLFRRLRPTVVIDAKQRGDGSDSARILTCLCLHPIGYYQESFAGTMVPTDDVVAHLMLMRADEHRFWKQANHHEPWRPESGL